MRKAKAGNSLIQTSETMQSYLHLTCAVAVGRSYYIEFCWFCCFMEHVLLKLQFQNSLFYSIQQVLIDSLADEREPVQRQLWPSEIIVFSLLTQRALALEKPKSIAM